MFDVGDTFSEKMYYFYKEKFDENNCNVRKLPTKDPYYCKFRVIEGGEEMIFNIVLHRDMKHLTIWIDDAEKVTSRLGEHHKYDTLLKESCMLLGKYTADYISMLSVKYNVPLN